MKTQKHTRRFSSVLLLLWLFAAVPSAPAHPQDTFYVFNGKTLEITHDGLAHPDYMRWQVWLYQEGVRIPRYTAGLQYSRWGLIEGSSIERVMKQLEDSQRFEEAYLRFFGSDTWGRYTFFNPLGPIAVMDQALEDQPAALEKLYQLRWLHDRVNKLIFAVRPSLENNDSEGSVSLVQEYFDQIRDALQRVSKLLSQLSHNRPQLRLIESGIAQAKTQVAQAESNVPRITAALPSVKLPTSKAWMSHTERAGSDGTIQVEVTETASGVSVHKIWSGGDGSMTGTVIDTIISYDDIGSTQIEAPRVVEDNTWTVRVQSGRTRFLQTVNSPQRKTAKAVFRAVNYATTESAVYLTFSDSAEAQDAYAYFLYHKQRSH